MNDATVKKLVPIIFFLCFGFLACSKSKPDPHVLSYPITPVSFTDVHLKDMFWRKRIGTNKSVTIPFALDKCEEEGRMRNFAKAGGLMEGDYEGLMPFDDSDLYKIIEGASYTLATTPDPELDKRLDHIIGLIAAAQEEDGYLCTWKTLDPDTTPAWWVEPGPRWHNLASSHELYNVGHMYEAAYAHYRATGKTNFLNIALKNADLIAETFGPGKNMNPPGHQIIESGLIKLFLITKDKKYLNLAKFFLDQRGNAEGHELYGDYSQDHIPVTKQKKAVGHAVRAVYMYAAMADIAALMKDQAYLDAIDAIWDNVVRKKLYITGGVGARRDGEAFGDNYKLPNATSYNETCAAIANVYWNHRMFLLHGESRYIDVLERTLYNGLISGVSLEGNTFFYPNCLESDGRQPFNQGAPTRKSWFNCSCCPTNIIRFIPSVPQYVYAVKGNDIYVNLYCANEAELSVSSKKIRLTQKTDYPWDGQVILTVDTDRSRELAIKLRIPGWASEQPVPSDLYHFEDAVEQKPSILLNGEAVDLTMEKGYASIEREWSDGDVIQMDLPMPVRRIKAHENVEADRGCVALSRGPIVYCAEGADNEGRVLDLLIPDSAELSAAHQPELLGGITMIQGNVLSQSGGQRKMTAIPYYAWSHRGPGEMIVWMKQQSAIETD